jgi:predicted polyphosphate/ATP-dependent NAD kinase
LVLTVIGGQGHIIGRGNQQITADLLRQLGRDRVCIVATRTKLLSLQQRPLVMDSGDPDLDRDWQGYVPVLTGFDDTVFYPLGIFADA